MKRLLLAFPLLPSAFVMACSSADGSYADEVDDGGAIEESATDSRVAPPPTDGAVTPGDAAQADTTPTPRDPELDLAPELAIEELAIFQGVKVPLEKGGVRDDAKKVHVVAGREGMLRVYVAPTARWSPREVVAELTLQVDGKAPVVLKATKTVSAASDEGTLDSTINVALPAGAISLGAKYKVRLLTRPSGSGVVKGASFPEGGALEVMDVWDTGASFKVTLVPVKANGYAPDTSAAQIDRYRKQLQAMYPVKTIELKVRDVYEYTGLLGARGTGISGLLDAVTSLRKKDGAPADVYYYGIFAPTSSWSTYCIGSCTTGLCHLPDAGDTFLRACVGVGFTGSSSAGTMAHELGHAHGIPHSPCGGVSGADSKFPYAGGKLGSWGWDERTSTLVNPAKSYDFMSYCGPEWISDYAYDRIIHRMSYVSTEPMMVGGATQTYRFVHVLADGTIEWGDEITLDEPMFGEPHAVTYVTADGARANVTGFYYPYAEEGGSLLVPTPSAGITFESAEVAGFGALRRLPALR